MGTDTTGVDGFTQGDWGGGMTQGQDRNSTESQRLRVAPNY